MSAGVGRQRPRPRFMYRCTKPECGKTFPHSFRQRCDACGTLIDVFYNPSQVHIRDIKDPFLKYFDLLPLEDPGHLLRMGITRPTPCIHAEELGEALGLRKLYLKDETGHPTGTTKDRSSAVTLSYFSELEVSEFITVSTGNAATSPMYGVKLYPQFRLHVFCGRSFASRLRYEPDANIQVHLVEGDLVMADRMAQAYSKDSGIPLEGGFFSIPKRDGLKLAYLEAIDQMPEAPAFVVQAVSSAIGIWSAFRAFQQYIALGQMPTMPRLVCVQQESCCPMYLAYNEGAETIKPHHIVTNPEGIAFALLRGNPTTTYPYIKWVLDESKGLVEMANEQEIIAAAELVEKTEGIHCGYAAACAVAGVMRLVQSHRIGPEEPVLINLTGMTGT